MKKYYCCYKDFYKRKRLRIGFRLAKFLVKLFFPKNEFIWKCEKPTDEPVFFVSNHTKIYAPLAFLLSYKKPIRTWSNATFLTIKEVGYQMYNKILVNRKPKFLLYPLVALILPLIVWAFRGFDPIPVYREGKDIFSTFNKSIATIEEKVDQIVFPEKIEAEMVNNYIYKFHTGFIHIAKEYYKQTKKCLKFYPTYTCQDLRKVLIGEPIAYDPEIPWPKQKKDIAEYLENQIKNLADSLPEHKLIIYG